MTREQYLNRRNELLNQAQAHLDAHELDKFNETKAEIEKLDREFEDSAREQANLDALRGAPVNCNPSAMAVNTPTGAPVATFGSAAGAPENTDTYDHAFMNFVCRGTPIPEKFQNATTDTTATKAVIPTIILDEIIRELKSSGSIYSQIRMLNIQGGVEVPIVDLIPTATWITEESGAAENQVKGDKSVSFSYFGLECLISQTLLANVTNLKEFTDKFIPLAVEAVIRALEIAIFNGTGKGQPLGITKDERVTNIVTLSEAEFNSYKGWKTKVFAKMKKSYKTGKFFMAEATFQCIDGMVDTNGQPVARTNYGIGADLNYYFGGKAVETVEEDIIASFTDAASGDIVAVFADLSKYGVNSNMQMHTVQWEDHKTHKKYTSVMIICDGKLLDPNGVIIIKKA